MSRSPPEKITREPRAQQAIYGGATVAYGRIFTRQLKLCGQARRAIRYQCGNLHLFA